MSSLSSLFSDAVKSRVRELGIHEHLEHARQLLLDAGFVDEDGYRYPLEAAVYKIILADYGAIRRFDYRFFDGYAVEWAHGDGFDQLVFPYPLTAENLLSDFKECLSQAPLLT